MYIQTYADIPADSAGAVYTGMVCAARAFGLLYTAHGISSVGPCALHTLHLQGVDAVLYVQYRGMLLMKL